MALIDKIKGNKLFKTAVRSPDLHKDREFFHAGSITLNLLLSGKVNGGIASSSVTMIAAQPAHFKTIITMIAAGNAQKKGHTVVWFDTEFAFDKANAEAFGMSTDEDKLILIQDNSIENVQSIFVNMFDNYNEKEDGKVFVALDSLGTLVTSKTYEDAITGNDKADMTVAKKRNTFSKIMLGASGRGGFPIVIINHTYACLSGDTMVKTKNVPSGVCLSSLNVGEEVLTTNGFESVIDTMYYPESTVYSIELEDGKTIEATAGHKFFVSFEVDGVKERKWVKVEDLNEDMELLEN